MCLGNNVSSTECDVNIVQAKVLTAVDRLSIRWNKIGFLPSGGCVNTLIWMQHMDADKTYMEKALEFYELYWKKKTTLRQHRAKQQLFGHLPTIKRMDS